MESFLVTLPHFRAVPADVRAQIAGGSRFRTLGARELLIAEGSPCSAFFAVKGGVIRIFRLAADGRQHVLHHLRDGQTFAEAAVLTMNHYPASAEAVVDGTEVLEIGREPFVRLFREDPRVSAAMVSSLCGWILRLVERVDELTAVAASTRVARYLLRLPSQTEGGSVRVTLPLAKKELAASLSLTPETLSRLLRRWTDDGVLESKGSEVLIHDADALLQIADG